MECTASFKRCFVVLLLASVLMASSANETMTTTTTRLQRLTPSTSATNAMVAENNRKILQRKSGKFDESIPDLQPKGRRRRRHLRHDNNNSSTKITSQPQSVPRSLQDLEGSFHDFEDVMSSLRDTTPMEWTGMQWLCLIIFLTVVSTVFSCICGACCCRPRYYGGGGYYGSRRGGSGGGCCSDIFWCLCCFEWCCRDCQDVDACCDAVTGSSAYRGM